MGVLAIMLMLAAVLHGTFFTSANVCSAPLQPPKTWWTIGAWKPR